MTWPLANLTLTSRQNVIVAFTAHSLPQNDIAGDDPYHRQLLETCRLLARTMELPAHRWHLSYQSAGRSGDKWLGPSIEDTLLALAARGERHLLVAPIGFVSDNLEILYDIDIALLRLAVAHNIQLERMPMLNDGDRMVSILCRLVDREPGESSFQHAISLIGLNHSTASVQVRERTGTGRGGIGRSLEPTGQTDR